MYYEKSQKERIAELEDTLLEEIKKYIDKNGYGPSVRELKRLASIPSLATTYAYMQRLQAKKRIDWQPKQPRTIRILSENQ